jgi:polysaccharide export outer membrane protein
MTRFRSGLLLLSAMLAWASPSVVRAQAAPAPAPATPAAPAPPPIVTTPQGNTEAARAAAARAGVPVTNQQIADAIRQSGMTEAQVRARLQAAGYDPAMADPFFRGATQVQGEAGADFAAALRTMGIIGAGETDEDTELRNLADSTPTRSLVFGKGIFRRAATVFDPVTSGPVDPSYRLGVGDNLQFVLTGEVELAYMLEVRRDGSVVLPQVGQVALAGLTLEGARTALRQRAGQSYSGIRTGATRLDLAIASIRTNAVFVIGDVEEPGAYQVSALATVFHALARAGGPTERGSFRAVELRRAGAVIQTVDLYRYLLGGDASQDVRLEQGDVIFVPLNTRAVALTGAVRRPAIFELAGSEGFADLVRFAGGMAPNASLDRVQVDRIVPAPQRTPGFDRVLLDIRLGGRLEAGAGFPLSDGDVLTVFAIGDTRRNSVAIGGAVFQPGDFEFRAGMTVDTLIARAGGLIPPAIRDRVLIQRLDPVSNRLISSVVNLDTLGGRFELAEFDRVTVLDIRRQYPERDVVVTGAVNDPGPRAFAERESLRDLIDRAGGFLEGAQLVSHSRRVIGSDYSDTTSVVRTFAAATDFAAGGRADSLVLEPLDRVDVRFSPGYRGQRFVVLQGAFLNPGVYAIAENVDRVADVIARAGGLEPHAHPESFQLRRGAEFVAIDFTQAQRRDAEHNIFVESGDTLRIRTDPRVVRIDGGVQRPAFVLYQRGLSVMDYIELAGGPVERAQTHRAVVSYPSGYTNRVRRRLFLFKSQPRVVSGAVITVPVKPVEEATNAGEILNRTLQVASTLASIAVAWAVATR